jgi:NADH:ubiquinone oxidoreductase subunit 6 (subunit J)
MAWLLMLGMALTGIGILIALYLPLLAAQFVGPDKIRLYAIVGAVLVVIGTAVEILSVWPVPDTDTEQSADD